MNEEKLEKLADDILTVSEIITTVRDACIGTDLYKYETVLSIAIDKQEKLYYEFESLY